MFELHPTLANDCHLMGMNPAGHLLLHKNATVPWLILVPHTELNEIYKLPDVQQSTVNSQLKQLAAFSEAHFVCDKLNIASIGNVVPQLHIHIISRYTSDPWWPQPVWGQTEFRAYADTEVEALRQALTKAELISPDPATAVTETG